MDYTLREAKITDLIDIYKLYKKAYGGTYPDPIFSDINTLEESISDPKMYIFVAEVSDLIVGSVLFLFDEESEIGKASAGVVEPKFRGNNLTQKLIRFGIEFFETKGKGLSVLYVTTRTVHKAAQVLTQSMGFKQLGIFPNVHKTNEYETHALAALYFKDANAKRYINFEQHPYVLPLYNLVRENIALPEMKEATIWEKKDFYGEVPKLEVIEAERFIQKRMKMLKEKEEISLAFVPFHSPNLLITSAEQNIEVYAYVNEMDKHCVITGCKIDREVSFTDLFLSVSQTLRDRGIRYIEVILRANRLNIIDKIIKAKYLPCAYVPSFQKQEDRRYDYVVFSRSFEILDFNNLELTGASQSYLDYYIQLWEETFLGSYFKKRSL